MTKTKLTKLALTLLISISTISLAYAMTVDELIESYDYDYVGSVNVTNATDYLDDTLTINITTNTTGNYYVTITLFDTITLTNTTNTSIIANQPTSITFNERDLQKNQYNYTIEIHDQDLNLQYRKYKTATNVYAFEQGTQVTSITDQNTGNIYLTITLNNTINETTNATVYLDYNNHTIQHTETVTITAPHDTITLTIPNETIKATHYNGPYTIKTLQLGTTYIQTNHTTASYNYEDFATDYIKNITITEIDNNSNNLTDELILTYTVVTGGGQYTASGTLARSTAHTAATSTTLPAGTSEITLTIHGEDIYAAKESGTFTLVSATLTGPANDSINNALTTELQYTSFEPPARPDITLTLVQAEPFIVTVANEGAVPAANIIIDIFNDDVYENQTVINTLNASEATNLTFHPPANTIVTAIADFNNEIDEENETNNIVNNLEAIMNVQISSLSAGILEGVIANNGNQLLENVSWNLSFGDGTTLASTAATDLPPGERTIIIAAHTYPGGTYNATLTGIANETAEATITIDARPITVEPFTTLYEQDTHMVLEGSITGGTTGTITIGEETRPVTFNTPIVLIEAAFQQPGLNTLNVSATSDGFTDTRVITTTIAELFLEAVQLAASGTTGIIEFTAQNLFEQNTTFNWTYDTGSVILPGSEITLTNQSNVTVLLEHDFGSTGTYATTVLADTRTIYEEAVEVVV
ncbi:MAG: hypothetical protein OXR66_01165 [Candidatus Woesearchaeota archaeon]|nr:hypothetical protein [Candidatus Woesearchaeota archaeon]